MSDHAELAPSAAHRWMRCPGSVRLCRGLDSEESEYAREGTFAHSIGAQLLLQGLHGKPASSMIGVTDGDFTVTEEMAGHLQTYVDAVHRIMMTEDTTELLVEQRVSAIPEKVWGTGDVLIYVPHASRLHVVDFKYGAGIYVEVEENEQLMTYADGALALAEERCWHVKEIVLHIVQPRRLDGEGNAHRSWRVSVPRLDEFHMQLVDAAAATQVPNAPLVPGDHCGFCAAKTNCPALRDRAMTLAQDVFGGVPLTPTVKPPHPSDLTPEQLGNVLDAAELLDAWIKGVREHAENEARRGVQIPGRKLIETLSNRSWRDETAAEKLIAQHGADPWARKLVSPAEAERRLGKKGPDLLKGYTERLVSGVKLVAESDKRPAADAASVFRAHPLLPDNE